MIKDIFTTQEDVIRALLDGRLEELGIEGKWALISIYRNRAKPVIESPESLSKLRRVGCKKAISVCFGDYTDKDLETNGPNYVNLITIDQASQIVRFLKRIQRDDEIKTLIVQCKAGISRSGAVGLYAYRLYGLDESYFLNSGIRPNYYVYGKLVDVFNPLPVFKEGLK